MPSVVAARSRSSMRRFFSRISNFSWLKRSVASLKASRRIHDCVVSAYTTGLIFTIGLMPFRRMVSVVVVMPYMSAERYWLTAKRDWKSLSVSGPSLHCFQSGLMGADCACTVSESTSAVRRERKGFMASAVVSGA